MPPEPRMISPPVRTPSTSRMRSFMREAFWPKVSGIIRTPSILEAGLKLWMLVWKLDTGSWMTGYWADKI
jgi:hypothetical protein